MAKRVEKRKETGRWKKKKRNRWEPGKKGDNKEREGKITNDAAKNAGGNGENENSINKARRRKIGIAAGERRLIIITTMNVGDVRNGDTRRILPEMPQMVKIDIAIIKDTPNTRWGWGEGDT